MLLRHTVTALALAATLGLNRAPIPTASGPAVFPGATAAGALEEFGGSGPGLTCLGCVSAGVITLSTIGWTGVLYTFLVGGTAAVTGGAAVVGCVSACAAYLSQD